MNRFQSYTDTDLVDALLDNQLKRLEVLREQPSVDVAWFDKFYKEDAEIREEIEVRGIESRTEVEPWR